MIITEKVIFSSIKFKGDITMIENKGTWTKLWKKTICLTAVKKQNTH